MQSRQWVLDRAGFPMFLVEAVGSYLHWVPLTKVQLETYLCGRPPAPAHEPWYESLLRLNGRCPPQLIGPENYWQAFATGLKPAECQAFADWNGELAEDSFALPGKSEWLTAYKSLKQLPPLPRAELDALQLRPRVRRLLLRLEDASARAHGAKRTLADQMLLRGGVMEWVHCQDRRGDWGAFGRPHPRFHTTVDEMDLGQPSFPVSADNLRLPSHGLRLFRRTSG
jgi:hypothetical protein